MSKPTIILVPGAWHTPDAYTPLTDPLKQAGYPVVGIPLTTAMPIGAEPVSGFEGDIKATRAAIEEAVGSGQDVIVLVHSYGGIPGSEAIKGLSKQERAANGEKGGVTRMVFLCAFAADVGVCLLDALGGNWLPWWEVGEGNPKIVKCIDTENIFYNDLPPNSTIVTEAQKHLIRQSENGFLSKATYAAWKDVPSVYIVCEQDKAIPPEAQEGMASQPGNWVDIIKLDAGHIPFLAKPKETVEAVRKACGET